MGENNLRRFEGLVNIPFAEDFALRMNMVVNKRDGLLTDAVTGEDYDRQDNWRVRAAVGWTPSEMTDVCSASPVKSSMKTAAPPSASRPCPPRPDVRRCRWM
ncbi:MAG: hypothetical protein JKP95_03540 [Oceanicaulis sp.]|nr:hypothetical protein [Oceanicaulis sp.]